MRRFIGIAVVTLLLISVGFAQSSPTSSVPNFIRYSGTLKDSQGAATVGVTFAIYKQQDGGAPVWLETQSVTTDPSGNYSVLLGSTTATGLPDDLFSQQEQRWLGVQVQGQAEQPRVLLVSVPYAFKAIEADRLAGHDVTEFVTTESLQSLVKEEIQQSAAIPRAAVPSQATTGLAGLSPVVTDPATNFADNNTSQVVQVQQSGTGMGLTASAPSNVAVVGTTNANAISGIVAGVEGVSSLNSSYGVYGRATSTSSTNPGIGVYGQSDSPGGLGLSGWAAGTGNTIGLQGGASSTSGFAINATETATSGNTAGLVARIYSPMGTPVLIFNNSSNPVTGPLISARTTSGVQFTVGGTGSVTAAGTMTGTRLISTVAKGTAPLQVTSTTVVPNLNASLLGGTPASGFIQNGTSMQASTNFDISGNGILGGFLIAANSSAGGSAVTGNDTATTGSSSGVSGKTSNPLGAGVTGTATATTGTPSGVLGLANSINGFGVQGVNSLDGGIAVFGHTTSTTGSIGTWGILGQTDSAVSGSTGVRGKATAPTGIAHGVHGTTNSATNFSAGVAGNSTATTGVLYGVFGLANSTTSNSAGVNGFHNAVTGQVFGVKGNTNSTTSFAAGVNGFEGATAGQVFGVSGSTNSATNYAAGVSGYEGASSGVVFGVQGGTASATDGATGVSGNANATTGATHGVQGNTNSTSDNASGVAGNANGASGRTYGVTGGNNSTSQFAAAVNGYEGAATGQVFGVNGSTNSTTLGAAGVNGFEGATTGQVYGVNGSTNSATAGAGGVYGYEGAASGSVAGVIGTATSTSGSGVYGNATASSGFANGVQGVSSSTGGNGLFGNATATSGFANGVNGQTSSPNGSGVFGVNNASGLAVGVTGLATDPTSSNWGIKGMSNSTNGVGVEGFSKAVGIRGQNLVCNNSGCTPTIGDAGQFITAVGGNLIRGFQNNAGTWTQVFSVDASGNGSFSGNLHVSGTLSKGGGSFKIDDPLDPENKYLSHSFVESPDMMNVYNGNITTDAHGVATVVLPGYFDALNRDFRYQLTVIGPFAQAVVAKEIQNNRFTIRTNKPRVKVSWQVTGIRQDAWANAHRIPVEEEKPEKERGRYLNPELYGTGSDRLASARR